MNCKKCNTPIEEGTTFCPNCGEKVTAKAEKKTAPVEKNIEQPAPPAKSKAPLIIGIVVGAIVLLITMVVILVLVATGVLFASNKQIKPSGGNGGNIVNPPAKVEKTVDVGDYTFTLPDGFDKTEFKNSDYVGNNDFYFSLDESGISTSTYDELKGSKYYIAIELSKEMASNLSYVGIEEETYNGQDYLIFRYKYEQTSIIYYYDVIYTKLYDDSVFVTRIDILPSSKNEGYELFTKFIKSAKSNKTKSSSTTEDYTVMGSDKLGYLKLPGKWTKGSVAGAADTSLQYVSDSTVASTAKGSYIVTLNIWKETPDSTTAKSAAEAEAKYYKTYDSDATNISVEKTKVGSFDAYKLSTQYKSDNVWVISWYIEGNDGLIHIIQVEGLDLTNDYFKIPETFSFTKIN